MKKVSFTINNLFERCAYTINKISFDTLREALDYQCYRLDLECIVIEPEGHHSYKRPIAIIPSIDLSELSEVLENPEQLEPSMIDVLVVPITKKIEDKFNTTIGGRIWSVNKFTALSAYGIAFNNGEFFTCGARYTDLKFDIEAIPKFNTTEVRIIKL